jgi:uptake hydrogenase large subunit
MSRKIIGPFNRVEGDLEVQLDIKKYQVEKAWVVSPMYRGFEQILKGKEPLDALVYTPRICGICSVSQSVATAYAIASAQHIRPAVNGERVTNLILATENIADHLSHFYLFFMPDFSAKVYEQQHWYSKIKQRFQAIKGTASKQFLPARADFMMLMGILAGKWPHSLAIQPGGISKIVSKQDKIQIKKQLFSIRSFLQNTLFGDNLEKLASLSSKEELDKWMKIPSVKNSDFGLFVNLAKNLELDSLGKSCDRFMSYGAYAQQGIHLFSRGVWDKNLKKLDISTITEDISHSWMAYQDHPKHPSQGVTVPDAEKKDAYSWCKSPRLDGQVVEVGALARQQVSGHPLIRELVKNSGGNVQNRIIARMLEIALVIIEMEKWNQQIQLNEPFCIEMPIPEQGVGYGLIEAARGSLGHWVEIKNHRILNYQIIAPTTWNFSPRDEQQQPGALEQALKNAPLKKTENNPISVQHIVRSFDPCMVCTVH